MGSATEYISIETANALLEDYYTSIFNRAHWGDMKLLCKNIRELLHNILPCIIAHGTMCKLFTTTAFLLAASIADIHVMRCLLEHGISPNVCCDCRRTALFCVVDYPTYPSTQRLEAAQLLMDSGCNMNHVDLWGNNALLHAVVFNDVDMFQLLVANGANCESINENTHYNCMKLAKRSNYKGSHDNIITYLASLF